MSEIERLFFIDRERYRADAAICDGLQTSVLYSSKGSSIRYIATFIISSSTLRLPVSSWISSYRKLYAVGAFRSNLSLFKIQNSISTRSSLVYLLSVTNTRSYASGGQISSCLEARSMAPTPTSCSSSLTMTVDSRNLSMQFIVRYRV